MTPTNETSLGIQRVLETILATVESIEKNVGEILDHVSDHVAEMRYAGWRDEPSYEPNGSE